MKFFGTHLGLASFCAILMLGSGGLSRWWRGRENSADRVQESGSGVAGATQTAETSRGAKKTAESPESGPAKPVIQQRPLLPVDPNAKVSPEQAEARRLVLDSPQAALDFIAKTSPESVVRQTLITDAAHWLYQHDPESGLAMIDLCASQPGATAIATGALKGFPPKDLPVLATWLAARPPSDPLTTPVTLALADTWWRHAPEKAVQALINLPRHAEADRMTIGQKLASLCTSSSPGGSLAGTMAQLERLPLADRPWIKELILTSNNGRFTPDQRLTELSSLPTDRQPLVVKAIFDSLKNDPQLAVRMMQRLPSEATRLHVIEPVTAALCASDAGAASEWAAQQPEGPAREAAARGLARGLIPYHPAEALTWAGAISNPAERLALQSDVIATVFAENSLRGRRMLTEAALPTETKTAITQRLDSPDFKAP
jgi:hypothetical protein